MDEGTRLAARLIEAGFDEPDYGGSGIYLHPAFWPVVMQMRRRFKRQFHLTKALRQCRHLLREEQGPIFQVANMASQIFKLSQVM